MNILRRQNFRSYTSLIVSVERSKIDHSYRCASQKTDNGQRRPFCRSMVISGWIERAARDRPTSAISETARRLEIFCQGLFTFQTRGGQLRWEIILFFFCFFFLSFYRSSGHEMKDCGGISLRFDRDARTPTTSRWKLVGFVPCTRLFVTIRTSREKRGKPDKLLNLVWNISL